MAEAAKALGLPTPFEYKGKTYLLSPATIEVMSMFEVWLEQQAWNRVERTKSRCDPETYRERHDAVTRFIMSGGLAAGSMEAAKAANTVEGQKYDLYLRLMACPENKDKDISESLASEMWEAQMQEIMARKTAMDHVPNSEAPGTTTEPGKD